VSKRKIAFDKAPAKALEEWRFAMALLKRVTQGQAEAAAGRTIPHEQVMSEVQALIDAGIAKKKCGS
jgi:predicted transcriptional regulator